MSIEWAERLAGAGTDSPVGGVDDSCDNVLAETINGLCKARSSIAGCWSPGTIPPAEIEDQYHAGADSIAMAA